MAYQPNGLKQIFHNYRRFLARNWLQHQPALQVAITGSYGKTNTTQLLAKILATMGEVTVTDPDLDTTYNVPITALKVMPWTKFAVFELGIDHPGEMNQHLEIVKPNIALVTGISPVHTDPEHLGSFENLIKEKRKLIEALPKKGFAILNYDDENVRDMAPCTQAKILWYGSDPKHCDLYVQNASVSLSDSQFSLKFTSSYKTIQITSQLIGSQHKYTIMASLLTLEAVKKLTNQEYSLSHVLDAIKAVKPLPGRMSVEPGPVGTTILNDSLRANPASTVAGLQTLSEIKYKKGRKIAVLAEMGELEKPGEEHKKVGKVLAGLNLDLVIGIGPWEKYLIEEAAKKGIPQGKLFWAKDVIKAGNLLKKFTKPNDLIYLKGSLLKHVERVLLILEGREVGCTVVSCPFYWHCPNCKYLKTGYQNLLK